MIFAVIIIVLIYGLINFMIAKSILMWLHIMFASIPKIPFYIIYSLGAISIIVARLPLNSFLKKVITLFSNYWMSFFFYLFIMILIAIIIISICSKTGIMPISSLSKVILVTGFIILILLLGMIIYGRVNATNIKYKNYEVEINKQTNLDNLKVVLISDLHLGYVNDLSHMKQIVKKINVLNPDVVLIAGDIFDGDFDALSDGNKFLKQFDNIKSKYGIYASLGNHDAGSTYEKMINFLEQSSVNVLLDEAVLVEDSFVIVGRRDSSPIGNNGDKRLTEFILENDHQEYPVIVLDHQPSNINEYQTGIDLIVAGHTHQGQIFPANIITKNINDVDYGYYQKNENTPQVIVTSGVGTWGPPLRIGTNNEIVQININFK